jgi:hypothetical protein
MDYEPRSISFLERDGRLKHVPKHGDVEAYLERVLEPVEV